MENTIKIHDLGGENPYFWKYPYTEPLSKVIVG